MVPPFHLPSFLLGVWWGKKTDRQTNGDRFPGRQRDAQIRGEGFLGILPGKILRSIPSGDFPNTPFPLPTTRGLGLWSGRRYSETQGLIPRTPGSQEERRGQTVLKRLGRDRLAGAEKRCLLPTVVLAWGLEGGRQLELEHYVVHCTSIGKAKGKEM